MELGKFFGKTPTLTDSDGQTPEEVALANEIKDKVQSLRVQSSRTSWESQTLSNIAYLCGADNVFFNSRTRAFQPVNNSAMFMRHRRMHVNKCLPTVQNRLAKLCKNPPKFDVMPESNDVDDKEAARLALEVLQTLWVKLGLYEKRIPLYMWVQQAGHAYLKICWDKALGNFVSDPITGESMFEGDIRAEVVSPLEVFTDPLAKTWDEALRSYVFHCKVRPLTYFKEQYDKGHMVKEEGAWLMSLQYESKIQNMTSRTPGSTSAEQMKDSAVEIIKYCAPTSERPNGRMIVIANGVVLADKELPCGEIPLSKFDDIIVGGKFYSESILTHLRPLQDQLNETLRRRAEWVRTMLTGKYTAARGSGIRREQLNNENGEVFLYDPVPNAPNGGRLEPLPVPTIPQYAYNEETAIKDSFNDISGISEVSRGNIPSASIPALGMSILQESDSSRVGIITEQHEHAWSRVGKLVLKYVQDYYVMPRKLKMTGKNRSYMVKEVSGDQLRGNVDVQVIRGSTLPDSKTLKRQDIINAYQMGLLGEPSDPKVREKVLELIEFGDVQGIWDDFSLDKDQIKRGMDKLEQGIPVEVSEFDNHAMWIQSINRLRKSEKFEQLSPEIQILFMNTMEAHIQEQINLTAPPPPPPADLTNPITPEEAMHAEGEAPSSIPEPGISPEVVENA